MNLQAPDKAIGYALIIGGNLVPFYGLLFWGWDIFSIFFLYWAENAVIGFYTLLMMAVNGASRGVRTFAGSLFIMAFFVFHYGMFCMAHLAILTELFGPMDHKGFQPSDVIPLLLSPKVQGFYIAIFGLVVAQGFSCLHAYLTKYRFARTPQDIMFSPYGRIVVLHLSILFGGLAAQALGDPAWALAVLIGVKTLYDIGVLKVRDGQTDPFTVSMNNGRPAENP